MKLKSVVMYESGTEAIAQSGPLADATAAAATAAVVSPEPAVPGEALEIYHLRTPDDFHVHLRQGAAVAAYTQDLAAGFARALVMPNTLPPVATVEDLERYRSQIVEGLGANTPHFQPLMSFKLAPRHDAQAVAALAIGGVKAGKLYPAGVTTNSEDGVRTIESIFPALEAMQEHDIVLCIHGEAPDAFCLDRETAFLSKLETIVTRFPSLRVVLEHLSTADAVRAVRDLPPRVAATITVHHLLLTLDDLIGGELRPHHFCKPVVKTPADRALLREVVLNGESKFFFGSDSAPHTREHKECDCGCAGLYTAPVSLPLLASFFEEHIGTRGLGGRGAVSSYGGSEHAGGGNGNGGGNGSGNGNGEAEAGDGATVHSTAGKAHCPAWVEAMEAFVSRYGAEFYQLPLNTGHLRLERRPWTVPAEYHGVVPFYAGEELQFRALRQY